MDFVKNLKAKLGEHNIFSADNNAVSDDDYVAADSQDYYDEDYDGYDDNGDMTDYDDYSTPTFTAEDGLGAPEYNSYDSGKKSYSAKPKQAASAPKASYSSSASSAAKHAGNIYNMNTVKQQNKYKLNSILLRDIYDAKNVASLMIDKDTIVVVNLSLLTDSQKIRAMDFLDGVKYVTKSVFARFTENICTFVPEGVELYGDFFSQIDIESFK